MDKPEALFLAEELEAPLGTIIGAELHRRAAAELRRLHAAEDDFHMAYRMKCDAQTKVLHAQRDALLEALKRCMGSLRIVSPGGDGELQIILSRGQRPPRSLRIVSPGGDGDPDVEFARAAIAAAEGEKT